MTAQPCNRFVFVSWSWRLPCNGNQALWKPALSTTAVDGRGTPLLSERVCSCACLGFERTCEANPAAHSFSQSVSNLFHFVTLSMPMTHAYVVLHTAVKDLF